jgi:hypothetical protein
MGPVWRFVLVAALGVVAVVAIVRSDGPEPRPRVPVPEERPAPPPFRYGLSNHFAWNRGALFDDPRLGALRLTDYRVVVPFDIAQAQDDPDLCRRQQWRRFSDSYREARERGMSVMVALERVSTCDVPERRAKRLLPTDAEYLLAVRLLLLQFPHIEWIAAWNEPNHPAQPLAGRPRRAARYLELLQERVCRPANRCSTVGAELALGHGWRSYLDRYLAALGGTRLPTKWGIHPYDDLDRAVTGDAEPARTGRAPVSAAFRDRIERLGSEHRVWLTEVGSFARRGARGKRDVERTQSEAQQAEEVRYLVDDLAPRLDAERVYYWSFWDHRGLTDRGFDTMLIRMPPVTSDLPRPSTGFQKRAAYDVYRCYRRADAGC